MELVVEPDTYSPSLDYEGNYIDTMPTTYVLQKGLYCPCGTRLQKAFTSSSKFSAHMKTKTHQKWLEQINRNKSNYLVESEKLKKTVQSQQKIIAELEIEVKNKSLTIDYLTKQLMSDNTQKIVNHCEMNLLDI